ncbi:MAG: hypothetical protein A2992_04025 [Elusimicrobia bacterium RIFCSPLOWO2_01_FULL_59_12]|nr:MAG: hypothetical protein A2992_04025 [Elusimicrobia bacterium RIFCSPLOWO2_01_FULL_59_12]
MINLILMLAFSLAIALFAVQNTATVQLQFLTWKAQSFPVAILVILSAAAGAALAFLLSLPIQHKRRKQLKQKERELSDLKDAISKH